jgi:hypothetical protein
MWSVLIVIPPPFLDLLTGIFQTKEPVFVQAFLLEMGIE